MRGFASGELTVDDLHENARAKVELALRDLRIGRSRFPRGTPARSSMANLPERRSVSIRTDGFVAADAQAGMTWGSETAPAPTTAVPAFATLRANRFRAAGPPSVRFRGGIRARRADYGRRAHRREAGGRPSQHEGNHLVRRRSRAVDAGRRAASRRPLQVGRDARWAGSHRRFLGARIDRYREPEGGGAPQRF